MKANAPEKIYLVNDDLSITREWYKTKQVGFETTEYVRKDAFIEKVAKWFEENLSEYCDGEDFEYTPTSMYNVTILQNERMIEDFKKAMKGEKL